MTLNELIKTAHEDAKAKGWWDEERNTGELLMLIVSECGEALEAHRSGRIGRWEDCVLSMVDADGTFCMDKDLWEEDFREIIKDGFADKLADIVIRIADWMGHNQWKIGIPYTPRTPENVGEALYGVVESIVGYEHGAGESPANCDTAIHKVFAIANAHDIDLWRHIELKLAYNRTRPHRHGKSY